MMARTTERQPVESMARGARDEGGRQHGRADTPSPFRVGDRVAIRTSRSGTQALTTVTRFSHEGRCMVLADGTEWRADGRRPWRAGSSFYHGPVVEPAGASDEEHLARRRSIGRIRRFADTLSLDSPLSGEALARILAVIEAESAAAAPSEGAPADADSGEASPEA